MCQKSFVAVAAMLLAVVVASQGQLHSEAGLMSALADSSCGDVTWSEPRTLADEAAMRVRRAPSITVTSRAVYVAGNHVSSLLRPIPPGNLLAMAAVGGKEVPPPSGDHMFLHPQIFGTETGTIHMIWGEPRADGPAQQSWVQAQVSELWTASYDAASGWTVPERIVKSASMLWWDSELTDVIAVRQQSAAIAVAVMEPERPHALLVVFDGGRWRTSEMPTISASSTVFGHDGEVFVGYLAAVPGNGYDINSVNLISSRDRGGTWTRPHVVYRAGRVPAGMLRLRRTSDEIIHLLWTQPGGGSTAILRHAVVDGAGIPHQQLADVTVPSTLNALKVATDACARLHVVFEDYPERGPHGSLTYMRWNGAWEKPQSLFSDYRPSDAAIAVLDGNRVGIAFLARTGSDLLEPVYQSMWSETIR